MRVLNRPFISNERAAKTECSRCRIHAVRTFIQQRAKPVNYLFVLLQNIISIGPLKGPLFLLDFIGWSSLAPRDQKRIHLGNPRIGAYNVRNTRARRIGF